MIYFFLKSHISCERSQMRRTFQPSWSVLMIIACNPNKINKVKRLNFVNNLLCVTVNISHEIKNKEYPFIIVVRNMKKKFELQLDRISIKFNCNSNVIYIMNGIFTYLYIHFLRRNLWIFTIIIIIFNVVIIYLRFFVFFFYLSLLFYFFVFSLIILTCMWVTY